MTDTENKTEKDVAKNTADTAPYMKKDNTPESSKSNIVIPLILLIVAVIVIVATFYKAEYSNMTAEKSSDADPAEVSSNELATVEIDDKTNVIVTERQSEAAATASEETIILAAETSSEPATDTASADEGSEAQQQTDNDIVTMQSQPVNNYGRTQSAYRPYPYHPGMQNPAKSHTQEQAQKYNEVMQQRRQAYEKEMEARRQQYEKQ
jgi:cytoskeletal protein RodZ